MRLKGLNSFSNIDFSQGFWPLAESTNKEKWFCVLLSDVSDMFDIWGRLNALVSAHGAEF